MSSDILNNDEIAALLNAANEGDSPDEGGLQQEDVEGIVKACGENTAAIAESLNLCLERQYRIEVGETIEWSSAGGKEEFSTAGLQVIISVGGTGLVVLIPKSLPLPEWYTEPGESEAARLQTLAMEWSMNLLPETIEAGEFVSTATNDLYEDTIGMQPTDWATVVPLQLFEEAEEPVATLWVVTAVTILPFESPEAVIEEPAAPIEQPVQEAAPPLPMAPQISNKMRRILNLPVSINVQLASKKIEMGQLMSISPGALITFNKPCEDLLDLYVNNCLYCRGEAIKIGEKFGLKINEIGSRPTQQEKVM